MNFSTERVDLGFDGPHFPYTFGPILCPPFLSNDETKSKLNNFLPTVQDVTLHSVKNESSQDSLYYTDN